MPIDVVINVFFAIIAYLIVGLSLEEGSQIGYWILIIIITVFYAKGLGNALVIAIANPQASAAAGPFLGVV